MKLRKSKVLIIVIIVFFPYFFVKSQAQDFDFGLKLGPNLACFQRPGSYGFPDSRLSLHMGIYGTYLLSATHAFQLAVLYSGEGERRNSGSIHAVDKLSYINIPLIYQHRFPKGFSLCFGYQLGVLMDAQRVIKTAKGNSTTMTLNTNEDYDIFNTSLLFGVGHRFDFGLGIGLQYNIGFLDLHEKSSGKFTSQVLQLSLAYSLHKFMQQLTSIDDTHAH